MIYIYNKLYTVLWILTLQEIIIPLYGITGMFFPPPSINRSQQQNKKTNIIIPLHSTPLWRLRITHKLQHILKWKRQGLKKFSLNKPLH